MSITDMNKQDRQCECNATLRRIWVITVAVEKLKSITNYECAFVWLLIQHVKRKRRIMFSFGLSGCATFSTLSKKRHDFREKDFEHKIRIFIFSEILVSSISHCENSSAKCYHKRTRVFMYVPVILVRLKKKLQFSRQILEKYSYEILQKSVHWEPSCSKRTDGRTDGQTDMMKLVVVFCNFAKAPKMRFVKIHVLLILL